MKTKLKDFVVTFLTEKGEEDVAEINAYSREQAEFCAQECYRNIVSVEYVGQIC